MTIIKDIKAEVYDPKRVLKGTIGGKLNTETLYLVSQNEEYQIESNKFIGDKFIKKGDFLQIDKKFYVVDGARYSESSTWYIQLKI